jgi:hypothetical protein
VSTPPVVHYENEASAQSLTDQDIDNRLDHGVVISNTALAIRQATARPGFGTRAPDTRTKQVAGAGQAQLIQAVGQSRGFGTLGDVAAREQRQPAEQPHHEQVEEAEEHECRG